MAEAGVARKRALTVLAVVIVFATGFAAGYFLHSPAKESPARRSTVTVRALGLRFDRPAEWTRTADFDSADPSYEGTDGFVHLVGLTTAADNPRAVCEEQAQHARRPFGRRPLIRVLTVDGQRACAIWPTAGSVPAPGRSSPTAAAFIPLPRATPEADWAAVFADVEHLGEIIRSIRVDEPA